jgi:acyl-coenzyme A thioesterase PaaI-like protein
MSEPAEYEIPPLHFVAALGIEVYEEGGRANVRAELDPAMRIPGTDTLRLGILTTFVDFCAGFTPTGPVSPTVDLRTWLLRPAPTTGMVHLVADPLKEGKRLYISEVTIDDGDPSDPFAQARATFVNNKMGDSIPTSQRFGDLTRPLPFASFDDLFAPRPVDERTIEVDLAPTFRNGLDGTIQGGAQATIAEIAAEHALEPHGAFAAIDLDIEYLSRAKTGPVAAIADVDRVSSDGREARVRVRLVDRGEGSRIVSFVNLVCRRR